MLESIKYDVEVTVKSVYSSLKSERTCWHNFKHGFSSTQTQTDSVVIKNAIEGFIITGESDITNKELIL